MVEKTQSRDPTTAERGTPPQNKIVDDRTCQSSQDMIGRLLARVDVFGRISVMAPGPITHRSRVTSGVRHARGRYVAFWRTCKAQDSDWRLLEGAVMLQG